MSGKTLADRILKIRQENPSSICTPSSVTHSAQTINTNSSKSDSSVLNVLKERRFKSNTLISSLVPMEHNEVQSFPKKIYDTESGSSQRNTDTKTIIENTKDENSLQTSINDRKTLERMRTIQNKYSSEGRTVFQDSSASTKRQRPSTLTRPLAEIIKENSKNGEDRGRSDIHTENKTTVNEINTKDNTEFVSTHNNDSGHENQRYMQQNEVQESSAEIHCYISNETNVREVYGDETNPLLINDDKNRERSNSNTKTKNETKTIEKEIHDTKAEQTFHKDADIKKLHKTSLEEIADNTNVQVSETNSEEHKQQPEIQVDSINNKDYKSDQPLTSVKSNDVLEPDVFNRQNSAKTDTEIEQITKVPVKLSSRGDEMYEQQLEERNINWGDYKACNCNDMMKDSVQSDQDKMKKANNNKNTMDQTGRQQTQSEELNKGNNGNRATNHVIILFENSDKPNESQNKQNFSAKNPKQSPHKAKNVSDKNTQTDNVKLVGKSEHKKENHVKIKETANKQSGQTTQCLADSANEKTANSMDDQSLNKDTIPENTQMAEIKYLIGTQNDSTSLKPNNQIVSEIELGKNISNAKQQTQTVKANQMEVKTESKEETTKHSMNEENNLLLDKEISEDDQTNELNYKQKILKPLMSFETKEQNEHSKMITETSISNKTVHLQEDQSSHIGIGTKSNATNDLDTMKNIRNSSSRKKSSQQSSAISKEYSVTEDNVQTKLLRRDNNNPQNIEQTRQQKDRLHYLMQSYIQNIQEVQICSAEIVDAIAQWKESDAVKESRLYCSQNSRIDNFELESKLSKTRQSTRSSRSEKYADGQKVEISVQCNTTANDMALENEISPPIICISNQKNQDQLICMTKTPEKQTTQDKPAGSTNFCVENKGLPEESHYTRPHSETSVVSNLKETDPQNDIFHINDQSDIYDGNSSAENGVDDERLNFIQNKESKIQKRRDAKQLEQITGKLAGKTLVKRSKLKQKRQNNIQNNSDVCICLEKVELPRLANRKRHFTRLHHVSSNTSKIHDSESENDYRFGDGTLLFHENEKIKQSSRVEEILMDLYFAKKTDFSYAKNDRLTYQYFNTNVGFASSSTKISTSSKEFIFDRQDTFDIKFAETLKKIDLSKTRENPFFLTSTKGQCRKMKAYANLQKKLLHVMKQ